MVWQKVKGETYYPAFQCSNCGKVITIYDECFELPGRCPRCKEESTGLEIEIGKEDVTK